MKMTNILTEKKQIWAKVPSILQKLIKDDMIKGMVQGVVQRAYKSQAYKYYKSHNMRRKTDGKRLKNYVGISIRSNYTNQVNMYLTGQAIDGLHLHSLENDGVVMSYAKKDSGKIIGNVRYGTDIRTLNQKNQDITAKFLMKEYEKKIEKWVKFPITINIGR